MDPSSLCKELAKNGAKYARHSEVFGPFDLYFNLLMPIGTRPAIGYYDCVFLGNSSFLCWNVLICKVRCTF